MSSLHPPPYRIAVLDRDEAVLGAVSFALSVEGYEVGSFPDAAALLAAGDLHRFDCLVIDFQEGLDLVETLRRRRVTAPAILVATHPNPRLLRAAAQMGVAMVEKPLMGEALSRQVRLQLQPHGV